LYTPKTHLEIYRNTFVFSGSSIWNSLPSYIQNSNSGGGGGSGSGSGSITIIIISSSILVTMAI